MRMSQSVSRREDKKLTLKKYENYRKTKKK